jgi:hypothetical protein
MTMNKHEIEAALEELGRRTHAKMASQPEQPSPTLYANSNAQPCATDTKPMGHVTRSPDMSAPAGSTSATRAATGSQAHQVPLERTSPTVYVTGRAALNVIADDDWSGDWHFRSIWFTNVGSPRQQRQAAADLAGEGQATNTNPFLGILGVRDVTQILRDHAYHPPPEITPAYAANHLRALADCVYAETKSRGRPLRVNSQFNQCLQRRRLDLPSTGRNHRPRVHRHVAQTSECQMSNGWDFASN